MNEETKPEVIEEEIETADVAQQEPSAPNFADKTLAELSDLFQALTQSVDRMKRSKEAEAIKSAFYRLLSREKAAAGEDSMVDENAEVEENPDSPFSAIEAAFKSLYAEYKKERAEYNRQQEAEREENLAKKQEVIEDLKALVENQEDMKDAFPKFREIQDRWRAIGPVPQQNFRDINDTYQLYLEKFYDLVEINR